MKATVALVLACLLACGAQASILLKALRPSDSSLAAFHLESSTPCRNRFEKLSAYLKIGSNGVAYAKPLGGVYQFDILEQKGGRVGMQWTLNTASGEGKPATCTEGPAPKWDALLTMTEADCESIASNKLNPQMAFIQGKMKIKGSMPIASKFSAAFFKTPN